MPEHKNETMNKFFVSLGLRSLAADQEAEIVRQAFEQVAARPGVNEIDYREVWRIWGSLPGHVPVIYALIRVIVDATSQVSSAKIRAQFLAALQVATLNGDFNQ